MYIAKPSYKLEAHSSYVVTDDDLHVLNLKWYADIRNMHFIMIAD